MIELLIHVIYLKVIRSWVPVICGKIFAHFFLKIAKSSPTMVTLYIKSSHVRGMYLIDVILQGVRKSNKE